MQNARPASEFTGVSVQGMSRGSFVLRSALAVGALYGAGAVSPFVRNAVAQTGDVEILNFALTLELLEAEFYDRGAKLDLEDEVMQLATTFGDHEQQHVDTLTGTIEELGGTPASKPTFTFPIEDQASFLELAMTLEDTGVYAYDGVAPAFESMEILAAAGSIVQVEARHAAAIRLLAGAPPAPDAFDKTLDEQAVLDAVKPFIKS